MSVLGPENLDKFDAHIRLGFEEGQGLWDVFFFGPEDMLGLILGHMHGEEFACRWLPGVLQVLELNASQQEAGPGSPMCLMCDTRFWRECQPGTIIALAPSCDEPQHVTSVQLCQGCTDGFEGFASMKAAVLKACRPIMGDDIRELPPQVASKGHA